MCEAGLTTFKPVIRNCVANFFPALLCVASEEQLIFRRNRVNQIRNLPQMLASMIGAGGKYWLMTSQESACALDRFRFRSFDIHLYVGWRQRPIDAVKPATFDRHGTILLNLGGDGAGGGEQYPLIPLAHCVRYDRCAFCQSQTPDPCFQPRAV